MKVCLIVVAGLDGRLLSQVPGLPTLNSFAKKATMKPVTPAVTSTMQATLSTGTLPTDHGIIANGLFTHGRDDLQKHLDLTSFPEFRKQISFWEQANSLVQRPRFWEKHRAAGKKVAMLFWQNSMPGTGPAPADIIITPKPEHTPDGKTFTACWTQPRDLYADLIKKLGPFPLQNYWGPMAGMPSSQWIIQCAMEIWRGGIDLQLVYIPQMDYNLQRHGPNHPSLTADLTALDAALAPLVELIRSTGGIPIICGDYGIVPVTRCVQPNLLFRDAGLLQTTPDDQGKLLIDYAASDAVAMADHQIAHIYCKNEKSDIVATLLKNTPGIDRVLTTPDEKNALGLASNRSGDLIALAAPDAWFAHDWWHNDTERPAWQFSVDIHRKPGYDPRELFADPVKRIILQNPALVKGSHGIVPTDPNAWPVVLWDGSAPRGQFDATDIAGWISAMIQ